MIEPLHSLKPEVLKFSFDLPIEMFGPNPPTDLKPAAGIVVNVLDVIAAMLIDVDVVGNSLEHISLTYHEFNDAEGNLVYSTCTTSEFYRQAEIEVKRQYGEDVVLLVVNFCSDKTHVDRTGGTKVWPMYCTLGNVILICIALRLNITLYNYFYSEFINGKNTQLEGIRNRWLLSANTLYKTGNE